MSNVEHQIEFDSKEDCFGFEGIIEEEQSKTFGVEKQYCRVKHSLWSKQDKKLHKTTTIGSIIAEFFSYLIIFTAVFTACFLLIGTTVDDLPSAMTAAVFLSILASCLTWVIRHGGK